MPGTARERVEGMARQPVPAGRRGIALHGWWSWGLVLDEVKGLNALCRGDRCDA
jgi:hypothetical protein